VSIRVDALADGEWAVTIDDAGHTTRHVVTVPSGYAQAIGCSGVSDAALVRASFAFLLDREPAGSILRRFSVDVIPRFFSEYPTAIARYLRDDTAGPASTE
jgi:hypothetical protein